MMIGLVAIASMPVVAICTTLFLYKMHVNFIVHMNRKSSISFQKTACKLFYSTDCVIRADAALVMLGLLE